MTEEEKFRAYLDDHFPKGDKPFRTLSLKDLDSIPDFEDDPEELL